MTRATFSASSPGGRTLESADYLARMYERASAAHQILLAHCELTWRCNFRCVHCYCLHDAPGRELDTAEWKRTLDQLAGMGCLDLVLTGGEPLLRPDFWDIAAHARQRRFVVNVFTNAYLVGPEQAERLARLEVYMVHVTLYGASEAIHAQVTEVPRAMERVRRGVDALLEAGVRVKLRSPLLSPIAPEVRALRDWAFERGLAIQFNPAVDPRDDGDLAPLAWQLSPEAMGRFFDEHVRVKPSAPDPRGAPCAAGRTRVVISPFGDVHPCMQVRRSIGNLRESSLAEIWSAAGAALAGLRSLRVGDFEFPEAGPREYTRLCAGLNLMETGDPRRVASNLLQIGGTLQAARRRAGATA